EQVLVRAGDRVRRGEPIAQIDTGSLQQELNVAKANLADASQRFARRAPLARGRAAISREEIEGVGVQVVPHRGRVKQLAEAIADARVCAPFDGIVSTRYLDPGAIVSSGRPIIRLISDAAPRVRFAVPEEAVGEVASGTRVKVDLRGLGQVVPGVM